MKPNHDFPASADAAAAPLDVATLAAALALVAARSATGRAQARVEAEDGPIGLAALATGHRSPASFHPDGERQQPLNPASLDRRHSFEHKTDHPIPFAAGDDPDRRERS